MSKEKEALTSAPNSLPETTSLSTPTAPDLDLNPPISHPMASQDLSTLRPPTKSNVRKAKEALKERAFLILEEFQQTIKEARAAGKYEEALSAYKWLIDHIPAEDGERMVEGSSDKIQVVDTGNKGPVINIGLKIGAISENAKQLPEVIDITPKK
ncbi:MAG: hypothetical protein AB7J46_06295 [Candidatus Altimarinota bacterium]